MVVSFALWICFGLLLPGVMARFKQVIRSARWVNGTVPRKFARKSRPKLHAAESSIPSRVLYYVRNLIISKLITHGCIALDRVPTRTGKFFSFYALGVQYYVTIVPKTRLSFLTISLGPSPWLRFWTGLDHITIIALRSLGRGTCQPSSPVPTILQHAVWATFFVQTFGVRYRSPTARIGLWV